ncbi:MAG TPA: arabinogalactan endo-1,4-beta-galactosidase [Rhizomicrobium sp.]|nr:arabinogalactan endo-1,4-beta-galactosidase [Rhizomicrobium sp.]
MKRRFAAALAPLLLCAAPGAAEPRYMGADMSFVNEMEDCGAIYKENGAAKDPFAILKAHGGNLVRVRLWNDAAWTKYSNLADVKKTIARAHAQGMQVLLDFHYSDTWADGDKQIVPAAWAKIADPDALAQALYRYTLDTLAALDRDGLMPDLVQVGNEINREMLEPEGTKPHPIDWTRNAKLIEAGIRAVRDAGAASAVKPKVMLHIAQPENVEPWFADAAKAGVTDFDLIGISYYAKWSKYTIKQLGIELVRLGMLYPGKPAVVVETAYPWTTKWKDSQPNTLGDDSVVPHYGATREAQKNYLEDLANTVIASKGAGVVYWEPAWVSTDCKTPWGRGSSWENATLFDFDGELLPGIDFMKADGTAPLH